MSDRREFVLDPWSIGLVTIMFFFFFFEKIELEGGMV